MKHTKLIIFSFDQLKEANQYLYDNAERLSEGGLGISAAEKLITVSTVEKDERPIKYWKEPVMDQLRAEILGQIGKRLILEAEWRYWKGEQLASAKRPQREQDEITNEIVKIETMGGQGNNIKHCAARIKYLKDVLQEVETGKVDF